jgi:PAS domain S-box-containing protein
MNADTATEVRVLVIDDMVAIHGDFRKILQSASPASPALAAARIRLFGEPPPPVSPYRFVLDCATQGEEGVALVERAVAEGRPYAIAFVDMRMPPGWDGIETTLHLWAKDPTIQVVICTAYSDHTWEDTSRQLGRTENLLILKKPFDNIEVLQMAHSLAAKLAIQRQHQRLLAELDERVRERTNQLREAEGRFAAIFRASPLPTTLQALSEGRYLDANPAFLALLGCSYDDVMAETADALAVWNDAEFWRRTLHSLRLNLPVRSAATTLRRRDGNIRNVLVHIERVAIGKRDCLLTIIDDVTDRLLLERKFQQAQKMEAVGQLAAGIAHDFNNLLTVIQSYSSLLLADRNLPPDHREGADQIRAAAERAAALTRQLLVFTRRQITKPEPVDLAATLMRLRDMLRRLVPEHIRVECDCPPSLPLILADQPNLEQVVLNLVVNARDAMPEGGVLRCVVAAVEIAAADLPRHAEGKVGRFVQLTVADSGVGIAPEVVPHIFEPFFTTKSAGKGTGLGLSTVYAIVQQHGGWIEVHSHPGEGTTFELYFPAHAAAAEAMVPAGAPTRANGQRGGRGERILLVEDEPSVRLATSTIARRAGYDVVEAVDAADAIRAWTGERGKFALLVTDMVMPNGRSGAELATVLRTQDAQLKIIITTGYSKELLNDNRRVPTGARVLLKPFSNDEILSAIREMLDAKQSSEPRVASNGA